MPNLNTHDILFLDAQEYSGFRELLELEYGVRIIACKYPEHVSLTSRKLILETDLGTYFLKEKPEYSSEKDARTIAAQYQNFLSRKTGIVPSIINTKAGTAYLEWRGRQFFLTPYVYGRIYTGRRNDTQNGLAALRALWIASITFDAGLTEANRAISFESYQNVLPIELLKPFVQNEKDAAILQKIAELFEKLVKQYNETGVEKTYRMCHGDFSIFNLLFTDSQVVAINDFDNAKRMPSIQDMAEFLTSSVLVNYISPLSNLQLPVLEAPASEPFSIILDAYLRDWDLSDDEKCLLAIAAEIAWLDILVLALLREDYSFVDISSALVILQEGTYQKQIREALER